MKIRQHYVVVILQIRQVAKLVSPKSEYVNYMQRNAWFGGCTIYDCNFRESINLLKDLKSKGYNTFIER